MRRATGNRILTCVIASGLATVVLKAAEFAPAGGNFQVNSATAGFQQTPAIGMDAAGNFVVAWFSITGDANSGVYAQRFDPMGDPIGAEFRVDDAHTTVNGAVDVGMSPTGEFVITWFSGQDLGVPADAPGTGRSYGMFAKRYDAVGTELVPPLGVQGAGVGNEFQVNTTLNGRQRNGKVGMDSSGGFVVVWEDQGLDTSFPSPDGSGIGIFGQRFDSSGNRVGAEFQVNDFTAGNQSIPSLAVDNAGSFLVSWTSVGQDGDFDGIFAKRYDAAGLAVAPPVGVQGTGVGNEFQVNSFTAGSQVGSTVALHRTNGSSVIAWFSFGQNLHSFAKRYDATGNELTPPAPCGTVGVDPSLTCVGNEFRVNTLVTSRLVANSVAMDLSGNFVVVWEDLLTGEVFSKLYDPIGNEITPNFDQRSGVGNEFEPAEPGFGPQIRARAAMSSAGGFVVVWEEQSNGRDGDQSGIFAQRYDVCGDGLITSTESCDDGNRTAGDGCSATCAIEPGFLCSGEPSVCTRPPSCIAGGPFVADCAGAITSVELDGTGSSDPDMDALTYTWTTDCPGGSFNDPTSATPTLFVSTSPACAVACNVSLTVTDSNGVSDGPCSSSVSIADTTAPVLVGVPMDVTAECDAVPAPANVTVADTCDSSPALTFSETSITDVCPQESVITRTWTVVDACGNSTSATQVITVVDTTAPVFAGVPSDMIVECGAIPVAASVSATDNCDQCLPTFLSEVQTGVCDLTLTRTWTVSDACGNTTSQIQTILVDDITPPVATAGLTLLSSGDNEGGDGGSKDDDEGIFMVVASCSDNCEGLGGCGAPTVSAVLSCSNGQTVAVTPGAVVEIEVEDEGGCEIEMENGRLEIEGIVTLIVTCTDASGNTSTATAIPEGLAADNDSETDDDD